MDTLRITAKQSNALAIIKKQLGLAFTGTTAYDLATFITYNLNNAKYVERQRKHSARRGRK
jgi:hypothetical protein